jgi:hypothetical protein
VLDERRQPLVSNWSWRLEIQDRSRTGVRDAPSFLIVYGRAHGSPLAFLWIRSQSSAWG